MVKNAKNINDTGIQKKIIIFIYYCDLETKYLNYVADVVAASAVGAAAADAIVVVIYFFYFFVCCQQGIFDSI